MKHLKYTILIITMFLCSCSSNSPDGTYTFKYVEYIEDNQTKTTDCNNLEELRIGIQTICECKNIVMTIDENYYTFSMTNDHLEDGYFYISGEDMYLSDEENGEYKHTGWFHYKDGKIYYGINNVYVVLEK